MSSDRLSANWGTCPDCLLGNRVWVSPSDLAEALNIVQAVSRGCPKSAPRQTL